MIQREGEAQRGRFLNRRGVQIDASKRCSRLRQGGFKAARIPNTCCFTGLLEQGRMQGDDFAKRQIPHYARRL
jgi:hypothetical protein